MQGNTKRNAPRTLADLYKEEEIGWWNGVFKYVAKMEREGFPLYVDNPTFCDEQCVGPIGREAKRVNLLAD